ncbi:hypothetical protein [Halopseudomonas sabulinigri]|uniref:Head virion protein G6P n=1 Tax=Halopseudomonas sabulinigri TaxID=472181 RepID=A0ABP9ZTL5_9GAMM
MPFVIGFLGRLLLSLFGRGSAWLLGLLASFIPVAAQSVLKLFSRLAKIALVLAAISAALLAFSAAIDAAFSTVSGFFVPQEFFEVAAMFIPSNLSMCLGIVVGARIKSLIFFWVVRISEKFERA